MDGHDIVVIGASAGGLDPIVRLVTTLERGLPLSLFIALHMPADWTSQLPRILSEAGAYPAAFARGGERIERGRILIAPPDRHLILQEREAVVRHGPRENFWRPSIDVLFRSAAVAHGSRVVGVILSGSLDDGAAGLSAIARCNGVALVQDPLEATVRDMPDSALRLVPAAEALKVVDIANRLSALAGSFYRCHVGHAFTERSAGRSKSASSYDERARTSEGHAQVLGNLLGGTPSTGEA